MEFNWEKKEKQHKPFQYINLNPKTNTQIVPYKKQSSTLHKTKKLQITPPSYKLSIIKPTLHFIKSLPHLLSSLIAHLLNILIMLALITALSFLMYTFKREVVFKIRQRKIMINGLIEKARYHYTINKCDPKTRVPAMQMLCTRWECDIRRGVDSVEVCRIVFEVVGDLMDGFVGRFSWKSVGMFLVFLVTFLVFRNRRR